MEPVQTAQNYFPTAVKSQHNHEYVASVRETEVEALKSENSQQNREYILFVREAEDHIQEVV